MGRVRLNKLDLTALNRALQDIEDRIAETAERFEQLRSGAIAFTGDLNLGNFRLANVGTAASVDDALTLGELRERILEVEEEEIQLETSAADDVGGGAKAGRLARRTSRLRDLIDETTIAAVEDAVHGTATEIAYFTDTNEVTSNAAFAVDIANTALILNNATNAPQGDLDARFETFGRAIWRSGTGLTVGQGPFFRYVNGDGTEDANLAANVVGEMGVSTTATSPTSGAFRWLTNNAESFAERMQLTGAGHLVLNPTAIGVPAPAALDTARLNVIDGGSSTPAYTTAPLIKLQSNANTTDDAYLGLLSGTAGETGILFGDTDDADNGRLIYDHSTLEMQHWMAGAQGMTLTGGDNLIMRPNVSPNLSGPNGIIYGSDVASAQLVLAGTAHPTEGTVAVANQLNLRTDWADPVPSGNYSAVVWDPSYSMTGGGGLVKVLNLVPTITANASGDFNAISVTPAATISAGGFNLSAVVAGGTLDFNVAAGSGSQTAVFTSQIEMSADSGAHIPAQAFLYDDRTSYGLQGTASSTALTGIATVNSTPTLFARDTAVVDFAGSTPAVAGACGLRFRPITDRDAGATLDITRLCAVFMPTQQTTASGATIDFYGCIDIEDFSSVTATQKGSLRSVGTTIPMLHAGPARFGATGAPTGGYTVDCQGTLGLTGQQNFDNAASHPITSAVCGLGVVGSGATQALVMESIDDAVIVLDSNNSSSNAFFAISSNAHWFSIGPPTSTVLYALNEAGLQQVFGQANDQTVQILSTAGGGGTPNPTLNTDLGQVQTTDATATSIITIATSSNRAYAIIARCTGHRTDSGTDEINSYFEAATYKNDAGTLTLQNSSQLLGAAGDLEDDATWGGITFTVSGTNIVVQVTGVAAQTIRWHAAVEWQEVGS